MMGEGGKAEASHMELSINDMAQQGRAIIQAERSESVLKNSKKHWRVLVHSLISFTAATVFAYDTITNGASISMPSFLIYFGKTGPTGLYLPAMWASLWVAMSSLMQALGAILIAFCTDRWGRKWCASFASLLTVIGTTVQYYAWQRAMLMGGKMISGLGIGAVFATATTYLSEIAPLQLRGPLQAGLVLFVVLFQALALGIIRVFVPDIREQAFRNVFAIQWVVGGLSTIAWALAPESPIWLIRVNKLDSAERTMNRLYGPHDPKERLAYEEYNVSVEKELEASHGAASYLMCFKGTNLKRTMTVMFLYSTANIGGAALLSQNIYFLVSAGLPAVHCFDIGMGGFGLAALFIALSGLFLKHISQRNAVVLGLAINLVFMIVIGGLNWAPGKSGLWAIAILMNILISLQATLLQGVGWPIAAETSSIALRAKTLSLGIFAQTLSTWVFLFITPYMYNVDAGNLGAKTGFIYAGLSAGLLAVGWYLIPDTRGMTAIEIDEAYTSGIAPRRFQGLRGGDSLEMDKVNHA